MALSGVTCTNCKAPLSGEAVSKAQFIKCPRCKSPVMVHVFPALFRKADNVQAGEKILMDNEASCFFHPNKKAAVPCEMCGRFLCSLCEIELDGKHVCSSCIESGKKKNKLTNLENRRVLHDNIALSLAILPVIFFWPIIITAPASIFISIRHWKSPASIMHRTRLRFLFAIFLSSVQLVVVGLIIARMLI